MKKQTTKIVLLVALTAATATAVAAQRRTESVTGTVLTLGTLSPVRNARVTLGAERAGSAGTTTTTDDAGKFLFPEVPSGSYRITAAKPGYVPADGGSTAVFTLTAAEHMAPIQLTLTPAGAISGRVSDGAKPAVGAVIEAWRVLPRPGCRLSFTKETSTLADDRGEYQLTWLPPGRYYVAAARGHSQTGDGPVRSANTYAPGSTDWQKADEVEVIPGADVRNINVDLDDVSMQSHLYGTVTDSSGRRGVTVLQVKPSGPGTEFQVVTNDNGAFELVVSAPETYRIRPVPSSPGGEDAIAEIDVRGGDVQVVLALKPALGLFGEVTPDSPPGMPRELAPVRVMLRTEDCADTITTIER